MSVAPPPPPVFPNNGDGGGESHSSSSAMEGIKPSILILILILSITVIISVSLCLLLRHLNRRCLRHLSRSTIAETGSNRVSPEHSPTSSLVDSLPMFTFSSITRRTTTASMISGDCAVCLSKFEPKDQLRLLPLCCHAFHTDCIDTWLNSNQSCPLCRSPIYASDTDLMKVLLLSDGGPNRSSNGSDSFRIEIGSVSRRQTGSDSDERRRSYSIGSFDYIVDGLSEVSMNQTHQHQRSVSDKEEVGGTEAAAASEEILAADVANGRSWLKEYVDRLSSSVSSRALSFRSSGRFFTGSSRRTDEPGVGDWDVEANRVGEEISEFFRWLSGV